MKEEYRTDEQLQAMLSQYEIVELEILCDQEKRISRLCINPQCQKPSLICQQKQCKKCGEKNHIRCVSIQLEGLTQIVRERVQKQKDFISEVCKIQNRFIDELQNSRKALTKNYYLGNLQQKYINIFEEIYKNKNTKCVTGRIYTRIVILDKYPV